jgi:hypothetical protein
MKIRMMLSHSRCAICFRAAVFDNHQSDRHARL